MSAPCPEYGFTLTLRPAPTLAPDVRAGLRDALRGVIAARGLSVAAADVGGAWHHVVSRDGGQAIEADRVALHDWATARPEIAAVTVGPLVDLHDADAV